MDAPTKPSRNLRACAREEDFVHSFARGLEVIKAFGRGRESLTMAEIAHACQISRAGARRILLTLEDGGYVRRDDRRYRLTARILDLSEGYVRRSAWEAARPHLQRAADTLNESVSAGVLDGDDVVYMMRIWSSRCMRVDLTDGARLPAHVSSMGRVLLAAAPQQELDAYLRRASFPRYTAYTICDEAELRQVIDDVRQRGWCCNRGELDEALWCVATPQADRSGKVVAALHASLSAYRVTDEIVENQVVPILMTAAREIGALI